MMGKGNQTIHQGGPEVDGPSQSRRSTTTAPGFSKRVEQELPQGYVFDPSQPRPELPTRIRKISTQPRVYPRQNTPPYQSEPLYQQQPSYQSEPSNPPPPGYQPQHHNSSTQDQRKSSPRGSPRPHKNIAVTPSKASGGIPEPTAAYIQTSLLPVTRLARPQHLLVIIDLNGTLLHRPERKNPTKFIARPHTQRFLKYCIDTFTVVIWSSAKPENVRNMCNEILTADMKKKVAAIWGRDKFNLAPGEYNIKVQCYKRLTKIWSDNTIAGSHPEVAYGGKWDQTNTVLIDDSFYKGRSEPFNLIEIPEFAGKLEEERGDILPQVHDYLNKLSLHNNASAYLRADPWKAMAAPEGPPGYLQRGYSRRD